MASLLDTFRVLASFQPARAVLSSAPWEAYVDWAIGQGLAPLAAYNLEYRLAGAGAPEWARDRLLSIYQGTANDNVMKLVNFKRALDELEGRRVLVLGGASFAEALYPHVAFRPVGEIELLVRPSDVEGLSGFLAHSHFRSKPADAPGAARFLTDEHTDLLVYSELLGPSRSAQEAELFERALPMRVYGPSVFRLDLEDAVLQLCLHHARSGYAVPMLSFIDLRELLMGAPSMAGAYSRPCDFDALVRRAAQWRLERALYASACIVERLFPEAAPAAERIKPLLRPATRGLLERWVVKPSLQMGKARAVRGADRLRRLLAGGR